MGVTVREKPKESGVYWVFINHNGVRKSKKIGKDKRLAKEVAKKLEAKFTLKDFDMESFNRKVPTLKQYGEKWLALPHNRKEITQENYVRCLRLHVYPTLGKRELAQIRKRDLKAMFDDLSINGMATSNFQNIKAPLNHVFNQAVLDEWIDNNPLIGLTYSTKRNIDIKPLTEASAFVLLDAAKEYREGLFYPHILTLLRTGIRKSELCGLKWSDIDFENQTLTVERQVYQGRVSKTKNRKKRFVDMTPHLTSTLRALKIRKQKESFKQGSPFCEWVFTFNHAKPMTQPSINRALNACVKNAGLLKMRVHDLRHSYATIRLAKGHNIGDVSYQMGHSSIKITFDTYTHWIPGRFKEEVQDLDVRPNAPYTHPDKILDRKVI